MLRKKDGQGHSTPIDPLAAIAAHWQACRGDRPAPTRAEIDPHGFANALEYALIVERPAHTNADAAPPLPRIRLAGQHVCALMGMELRGMPLHALIVPAERARFAQGVATVFDAGATLDLALASPANEAPHLSARLILLPLADDRGGLSRALGGLRAQGLTGAPPRRLVPAAGWPHKRWRRPQEGQPQDGTGFHESAAPYLTRPHPRAPHLRLVKTDD
jgi:hypothetical protein